jgi:uncharacterized spore protein YtfJ
MVMDEAGMGFMENVAKESQARLQALEKLVSAADTTKVFGAPVTSGEYTVITAAEVGSGGGFGSGMGFGVPNRGRRKGSEESGAEDKGAAGPLGEGAGGGGGGGGGSMGRPVAAIVISPDGVEVKPVLDMSKMGLAGIALVGSLGVLALKVLKAR